MPVFKKDDAADTSNYRPISLSSVPSKIMESYVSDTIVRHVFDNNLITDYQWAYRDGYSTVLLLVHLSETWRKAVDQNKVVAVAFIDFRKAFDCVSHTTLLHKLRHQFGIQGPLFSWLTDYLSDRTQFSVLNGHMLRTLYVVFLKDQYWAHAVCIIHKRPAKFSFLWLRVPVCRRHHCLLYW